MEFRDGGMPGLYEILSGVITDGRGGFVKTFNVDAFAAMGLATDFMEEYFTTSKKGVIRGMHFQRPPMDHDKLVYAAFGRSLDVVLDLRSGSPTYGQHRSFELDAARGNIVYIPRGMAHGFCALTDPVVMVYNVTSVYSPAHDEGVHYASAGIEWPIQNPITSARDAAMKPLEDFSSPFVFEGGAG